MRATDPSTDPTTVDPTDTPSTSSAAPTRRIVLCGALVAAGGATLVACGGGDDAKDDAPAADKVLGPVGDVPVGGGKVYDDAKVVVTQPTAGDFKAFSAVCTHQQCLVGSVSGGRIHCPCHNSDYDANTGAVLGGPAPRPLAAKPIAVTNGRIVLKPA
ncbi:iron sulfur protein [Embleya scabrispora]|uniref:Cytochrome bc1 complex Rieske iron-sulfur subunit n=1 Tax=Embleya scabrispora TaxID=159449 RepID=A0A1T3NY03_9ACTN|nr:Rieske (2Fe-2S) protein [Embleya scabrispora]OPC81644.1 iron sulfur protein [Embleya scabrispora]